MSIRDYFYIGPYIECILNSQSYSEERRKCINNCKDEYLSNEKFCVICGSKLELVILHKDYLPCIYDLPDFEERFEDILIGVNVNSEHNLILIGNECNDGGFEFDSNTVLELGIIYIAKNLRLFKDKYHEVIKYLEENSKSCSIKFGAINHYN